MSFGGQLLFVVTGFLAVIGAVLTITQKSPLRAAVALLVHIVALAGLYLTLHAHLLAAIQLLVYAGAVVVLFVFVIMLIGAGAIDTSPERKGVLAKLVGGAVAAMIFATIASQLGSSESTFPGLPGCPDGGAECGQFGGVEALGRAIYLGAGLPFELVSALLLVAIVGVIAIARGHSASPKTPTELAELPPKPRPADPNSPDPSGITPAE